MLTIKATLSPSPVAGIGLFAAEFIPKGAIVWKLSGLDLVVTESHLAELSDSAREQIAHHIYIDVRTGQRILCGDNARFMNHSEDPNTGQLNPQVEIALRDIKPGEEITCDYRAFDADCQAKLSWEDAAVASM